MTGEDHVSEQSWLSGEDQAIKPEALVSLFNKKAKMRSVHLTSTSIPCIPNKAATSR